MKRLTIKEYLIDRAKREADHMNDEKATAIANIWLYKMQILSGDDFLDEYPDKLKVRIGKLYGSFLSEAV